jgi:leucyl/phenylalanyl-tRNA--protein transferase
MVFRQRLVQPIHPKPSEWTFPPVTELPRDEDLVAVGADLEPGTILTAYSSGFFPMPVSRNRIGWFHPDPRGILPPAGLRVSRSLRRSARRYTTTVNQAFDEVISACADPARPLGWIDHRIVSAYSRLHQMGWAHSVEVWDGDGFAGESMFHRRTDASKVALVRLAEILGESNDVLLDVQWVTPHLASLGAIEVAREEYFKALSVAVRLAVPADFFERAQPPLPR